MSPATSNALSPQQSQQLSAMQQQPQLNSNSKQQIMQQQNTANATAQAAAAAADYYEQQFKAQQNKNIELEQQLRMTLEQVKELKVILLFYENIFLVVCNHKAILHNKIKQ